MTCHRKAKLCVGVLVLTEGCFPLYLYNIYRLGIWLGWHLRYILIITHMGWLQLCFLSVAWFTDFILLNPNGKGNTFESQGEPIDVNIIQWNKQTETKSIEIESIKTTSMEDVSTRVLEKIKNI